MNRLIILSNGLLLVFFVGYFLRIDHVLLGVFQQLLILPAFGLQYGLSIYIVLQRIVNQKSVDLWASIHLGFSVFWILSFWID